MRAWLVGIFTLGFAAAALGQPAESMRVLRQFNFEERAEGNVEDVPMDWVKVEGPGLPHYVNGRLAKDEAFSGTYSFRFDLNGGSLVYRYPAHKIRVYPNATYRVTTMVKTDALPHARARLSAFCTDLDGHPIKASLTHSQPFVSAHQEWAPLTVELTAPDKSAWLVIDLGLLQQSIWRNPPADQQGLFEQDITGHAWFDDVAVAQVPRIRLSCDAKGNVFHRRDPVSIHVSVSDRITDDLVGRLTLSDADGRPVFQRTGALDYTQADSSDKSAPKLATLVLPELPAGWFRATLELTSRGISVGSQSIDLIQLADDVQQITPDPRFGIVATDLPFKGWPQVAALLPGIGAARAKLSIWNDAGTADQSPDVNFERVLERLHDAGIGVTACLAAPPPKMAAAFGGPGWDRLPGAPAETWQPQLSYLVSRYAGYIDRWQFGADDQAGAFATNPALRTAYGAMLGQFNHLLDQPDVAMPWPAWFDLQGKAPATVAMNVSSDVLPKQVPLYIQDLGKSNQALSVTLQTLPAHRYRRVAQLRDFAQRIAYALSADASRIDLPLPFSIESKDDQIVNEPQELLMVMRTMLMTLGNATYKGRVPLDPDVEAFLFDRGGQGVMLVWSHADHGQPKTVPVVLGNQPRTIDLWGNVSPVLRPKDDAGTTDLQIGPIPQFLVGIDGQLAQLRSSFAFDNPLVESNFEAHVRRLQFKNPYPISISGRLRLKGPQGWSVVSQMPSFTLAPGETYSAPVTIEFPYSSFAGNKSIICTVELQADKQQTFKVPVPLRLGLGDIGLETMAMRDGPDIIVQQMITNYSNKPVDYTAFATYPNLARQERLIMGLKPGATIIKKYRFTNADFTLNAKLRSGVRETEGTRILNEEVDVK
ncbi:MAG: COG1470 family protein [Tepidisphaeraceae bacterium]